MEDAVTILRLKVPELTTKGKRVKNKTKDVKKTKRAKVVSGWNLYVQKQLKNAKKKKGSNLTKQEFRDIMKQSGKTWRGNNSLRTKFKKLTK